MLFTFPWGIAIAIIAAASITHESGFHMKPKNLSILLSFTLVKQKISGSDKM